MDTCIRCIAKDITHIVTNSLDGMGLSCASTRPRNDASSDRKEQLLLVVVALGAACEASVLDIDFLLRSFHELRHL